MYIRNYLPGQQVLFSLVYPSIHSHIFSILHTEYGFICLHCLVSKHFSPKSCSGGKRCVKDYFRMNKNKDNIIKLCVLDFKLFSIKSSLLRRDKYCIPNTIIFFNLKINVKKLIAFNTILPGEQEFVSHK